MKNQPPSPPKQPPKSSRSARRHLRFASLFCGGGGLDIGFINAGFEPVAAFDISEFAIDHYRSNIGTHAEVRDLSRSLTTTAECDVVVAGSPCQGFSTIGKRNHSDPRNELLSMAVLRAIALEPRVIVLENVLGLMAGAHRSYLDDALRTLEKAKYRPTMHLVDAREAGLPQARRRLVIIGVKSRFDQSAAFESTAMASLSSVISGADKASNHSPVALTDRDLNIAMHVGEGKKLCDVRGGSASVHTWQIPTVFGETSTSEREVLECIMKLRRQNRVRNFGDADPVSIVAVGKHLGRGVARSVQGLVKKGYVREVDGRVDLKHTFNGKYRRACGSAFSSTVDTKFGNPKYFLHPTEQRGFTVREAARIQGFPDSYTFRGSTAEQYKLIGNAVPPPMAKMIAEMIRKGLSG